MDQPTTNTTRTAAIDVAHVGDAAAAITMLARAHGISSKRDTIDDFAEAASRLSDAEASPDGIERLLIALQRGGVIDDAERFALHAVYLQQKLGSDDDTADEQHAGRPSPAADLSGTASAVPLVIPLDVETQTGLTLRDIEHAALTALQRRRTSTEIMTYHLDGSVFREYPDGRIIRLAPIDEFRPRDFPIDL